MDPKHEEKIDELIKNTAVSLKNACARLYASGGVDVETYSGDEYVLAKILISAAMEQCKRDYWPLTDSYREDLRVLLHT